MPAAAGPLPPERDRALAIAEASSFAIPWLAGIFYTSPVVRFSDDVAIARALGGLPVGLEGLVSAGLGSVFELLPFGSRPMRLGWAAALGLGALSWLVFRLAVHWQRLQSDDARRNDPDRLSIGLALSAALASALGPMFLVEGSTPGGYSLAAALALAAVARGTGVLGASTERGAGSDTRSSARAAFGVGVLLAATALESRWAALAALAALGVSALQRRATPTSLALQGLLLGAAPGLALALGVTVVLAVSATPESGLALFHLHRDAGDALTVDRSVALEAWLSEVGLIWCALSLAGIAVGLLSPRTRGAVVPVLAFLGLDSMLGLAKLAPTANDPHTSVRLLCVVVFAAAAALAVSSAVSAVRRARIPFARTASTLLVVYSFTLVFVGLEDAARAAEGREKSASEIWTDEALASVPPRAVVLVRSEALVLRFLAERERRGARSDVLLIDLGVLERGGVRARQLSREPGMVPVVRDVLLAGRPGEFALSTLADTRGVFVEPEASWDQRLFSHLIPRPFFTEFAPHPLGRSDRRLGLQHATLAFERIAKELRQSPDGDPATRALLATELAERTLVLAALGDRDDARQVVQQLLELEPQGELAHKLKARLAVPGRGPLSVGELFAAR